MSTPQRRDARSQMPRETTTLRKLCKSIALLALVALSTSLALPAAALSPSCPDQPPKTADELIRVERDADGDRLTYNIVLPEEYQGRKLTTAWLSVLGPDDSEVKIPLAAEPTQVEKWSHSLVAFVHTKRSALGLKLELWYGYPCSTILIAEISKSSH